MNSPDDRSRDREDDETRSGTSWVTWKKILALALLIAAGVGSWMYLRNDSLSDSVVNRSVLGYLVDDAFAGSAFSRQILGDVELQQLNEREGKLYFSHRGATSQEQAQQAIAHVLLRPQDLEFGTQTKRGLQLGDLVLRAAPGELVFFFRTPTENFHVDRRKRLTFPFLMTNYTPTVEDLAMFIANYRIRQGWVYFTSGRNTRSVNFGAYVATPGEPSLTAFTKDLCRIISATEPEAREKQLRVLLRLVTDEITYDDSPLAQSVEVIRRPCEVLMTRRGDCANKAVLFASLLEQLPEDYLFLYTRSHLAVAVRKGNFPNANGLAFNYAGEVWVVCETTCPGFVPGTTILAENYLPELRFVQRPQQSPEIVDVKTGLAAPFLR